MRRMTILTALLLGATLLAPTGSATAAGETCRGEAATIVGTGPAIVGTPGRDVIVTGTSFNAVGGDGDDLICVAGRNRGFVTINAGTGADVVDTTAATLVSSSVNLGTGPDTFFGGPGQDDVQTGGYANLTALPDGDRDAVDTGAGADRITSLHTTGPNPDVIKAGPGDDYAYVRGPLAATGQIDGGDGTDTFAVATVEQGKLTVNAAYGTARLDGADYLRWTAIEALDLSLRSAALDYTGSDGTDRLRVATAYAPAGTPAAPRVAVDLLSGDDHLALSTVSSFGVTSIDAGSGRDSVEVNGQTPVKADLRAKTLRWNDVTSDLLGTENVSAFGSQVRLVGDDKRNVLDGGGCDIRAKGAGGDDELSHRIGEPNGPEVSLCLGYYDLWFDGGSGDDRLDGHHHDDVLRGGRGNDRMIGRDGNDTLIGGPGRDKATAGPDRDRCSAEVETSCER